jgi:hypothetical protein
LWRAVSVNWRDCEKCGYRAPFAPEGECLFCDSHSLTFEVSPEELQKRALEGRAAATADMVKSGVKLWFMSLFWRDN